MAEYCIKELICKARLCQETGAISVLHGDVVKADNIVLAELKEALEVGVSHLENVPDSKKDWHPGSNEVALDLVHPSLFPLVYGLTRIITDDVVDLKSYIEECGSGVTLPVSLPLSENVWLDGAYSNKFQYSMVTMQC